MKKIMFNDRYGLTQAVIEGRKIMTRRMINLNSTSDVQVRIFAGYVQIIGRSGNVCAEKKLPYKVGEVVAVAQRYSTIAAGHPDVDTFLLQIAKAHKISIESVQGFAGWNNKMFTKAELMPHQIRITGIKRERLQDISNEDCIKDGLEWQHRANMFYVNPNITNNSREWLGGTPREAFASLIDKVSGLGTWGRNPWVVAYEFELVK